MLALVRLGVVNPILNAMSAPNVPLLPTIGAALPPPAIMDDLAKLGLLAHKRRR